MPRWNDTISTNKLSTIPQTQQLQMHVYRNSNQKPINADHNSTGRVYNVHAEHASIACLHNFSGPALLSCSKILTYQLLGSQLWTALPLDKSRSPATVNKVSKSRHNSRTKLRIQVSHVQKRDNIEFYLHCKFQSLPFSVRRKNGVTDRLTD